MGGISTTDARDWESFEISGEQYLAVANADGNIYSKVYKWNGARFVEFQSIPTRGARSWESFEISGEHYLAVANTRDGSGSYNTDSKIYKWNGTRFDEFQSIATNSAYDWESFE